jgi:hypothetical protein
MMYCRFCRQRFFLASKSFRFAFDLLLVVYTLLPGISYKFFEHIWPKRYVLRQLFNKGRAALRLMPGAKVAVKNG